MQLGIGAIIPDADAFTDAFVSEFDKLKGEFQIETSLPFMPSNGLLKHGRRKAIALVIRDLKPPVETLPQSMCKLFDLRLEES